MQTYKSHGTWSRYSPVPFPEGKPENAMFLKRDSDGVDWYDYAHNPKNFTDGSAKLVIQKWGDTLLVNTVSLDPSFLFPAGATVLEVIGFEGDPMQFVSKVVDLEADTFTDPPPRPLRTLKADIWRRTTDTEADTLSNLLNSLPARKRRLYDDCQWLDHSDPFYGELQAAVVYAIGQERADAVLAAS